MTSAFWICIVLVFVMGVAIQRGNTCTVVAFDDLIHRRSAVRLLTMVYTWLLVAGGLTLLSLTAGFTPRANLFPVTMWSVVGGLLLGIGAVVNGACTNGTVARVGSGEYIYLMTIAGFAGGCSIAHAYGPATTIGAAAAKTTVALDHPVPALLGLAIVVAANVRRLVVGRHESFPDFLRNAWDPRTATFIIAGLFVVLVQIYARGATPNCSVTSRSEPPTRSVHGRRCSPRSWAAQSLAGVRLLAPSSSARSEERPSDACWAA